MPKQFESLTGKAIYQATHWSAFAAFSIGWSLRTAGRHHMPQSGPVLVVANHQSNFDPVLVGLCGSRPLTYLAKSELFTNRMFGALIRYYGAVPLERAVGKEGIQAVLEALNQKDAVLVFPEGERTLTGEILEMKPGIALLIKKTDCMIQPVGIAGAYDAFRRGTAIPKPNPMFMGDMGRSIALAYGPPIHSSELKSLGREGMLKELDKRIRDCHAEAEKIRRRPK